MTVEQRIRYGDYRRETSLQKVTVSYSKLTRLRGRAALTAGAASQLRLSVTDIWRILAPYVGWRALDQIKAVTPLALYLVVFQILILRQAVAEPWVILAGMVATIAGLMLFMEGLRVGLMPFGGLIGHSLPRRSPLGMVLAVAFVLGIGVTYAEPAIGALKTAGAIVEARRAPLLYALLNGWAEVLVLVVGLGVGAAAVLGTLMFIRGWSVKPVIAVTTVLALSLTALAAGDPELERVIALAWDCGGVTTGPVTVPLVLALGVGVAASAGKGESSMSGFGIVTLASLFPVIAVLCLAVWVHVTGGATAAVTAAAAPAWHETTPWAEVIGGLRAILPLVLFLVFVARVIARTAIEEKAILAYGLVLCVAGMIVFNLGLTFGLAKLGGQSGTLVPAAFMATAGVANSPLYAVALGLVVALAFAWLLGFGATLAEPALAALGLTVETLTNGAMTRRTLIYAVSVGVGSGLALGVAKLVFGLPLVWLLLPGYGLALLLSFASSEEMVAVAWDSAGVTTGPVTVPLVLAMGLGLGQAVGAVEGFGILAMASVCPIIAVLAMGLWVRLRLRRLAIATTVLGD